jgi:hypothetical protein
MNKKWSPYIVDQPRLAKAGYKFKAYIWKSPYTDLVGEKCGLLISMLALARRSHDRQRRYHG